MTPSHGSSSEDKHEKRKRWGSSWRSVEPEIWARKSPPAKGFRRIGPLLWRIISIFLSPVAAVVLFPLLAGTFVLVTFSVAYQLGGVKLFGPVVLGIWAAVAALGVFVIEKTGYARNFEGWDFKLRNNLFLLPAFLLCLGLFYFMVFLARVFG